MTITDLYLVIRCMKSAKDENGKIDFDKFMEELERELVKTIEGNKDPVVIQVSGPEIECYNG